MNDRRRHLIVQIITGLRIPLAVAACAAMHVGGAGLYAAMAMLLAIEISDLLDGKLARRWKVAGTFGELFDPYCDSISRMMVFAALAWAGASPWWLVLLLAFRDVSVAYIRIMCTMKGSEVKSRFSGKLKAVVQGVGGMVLLTMLMPTIKSLPMCAEFGEGVRIGVVGVIAAVTMWSALDYFIAAVRPMSVDAEGMNNDARK